jgi:hypothetical protein
MMFYSKARIGEIVKNVEQYVNIEVTFNEKNILVIADNSQAINEFEARLAASTLEWDGEDCNGKILLDNLVNIQGVRTEFRTRYNDEWQARYDIVATD